MKHFDLAKTASEQIQDLASGKITAEALLETYIARFNEVNGTLNAVVRTDFDAARKRAREIDQRRAAGEKIGPLEGLPMTVKDSFDVNGMPAVCGVPKFAKRDDDVEDAILVDRLKKAGAVIWGKTNSPMMAGDVQTFNKVYGVTNHHIDQTRSPGGSSGGSAASLASLMTPLEIGSDIGGSLRNPAHFSGVCAFKPTWGLLPSHGHVPPSPKFRHKPDPDLAVVGPMARNIKDLQILMEIISAGDIPATEPSLNLKDLRIAFWMEEASFPLGRDCVSALENLKHILEAKAGSVTQTRPDLGAAEVFDTYLDLLIPIILSEIPSPIKSVMRALRPVLRLMAGKKEFTMPKALIKGVAPQHEIDAADQRRKQFKQECDRFFETQDVLIAPVTATPAVLHKTEGTIYQRVFDVDGKETEYLHQLNWISLATVCHLPVVVIPVGMSADGLPIGVQLIGPEGGDAKLLEIARLIEAAVAGS
jgi:amidase